MYEPPKVWTWNEEEATPSGNRPTAGARLERDLPVGEHRFQLYSLATPNGVKVSSMFEELLEAGYDAEYDAWLINIGAGDQFGSGFVEVNPNSKIPALLDTKQNPPQRVFESGSILLYLAEEFGYLLPKDPARRTEALNWLFWQVGAGPFLGGGFGHFYCYAPVKIEYAVNRFAMEAKRQLDVLDQHLSKHEYLADEYSIADIIVWPWYGELVRGNLYNAAEFLSVADYKHVVRWAAQIAERPAIQRGVIVNRTWGDESQQLRERHSAADFASH